MRIEYIDKLKGLAIVLVVMGHVLEWGMGIKDSYANIFYAGFHMPLFMFLSGIFAMKSFKTFSFSECISFFYSKVRRIFLPFFIVGGLFSLLLTGDVMPVYDGELSAYWFLPALFYAMIVEMMVGCVLYHFKLYSSKWCDMVFHLLVFGLLSLAYYKTNIVIIPFFLYFIKMYPFFLFGIWFAKYPYLKQLIQSSGILYSISIVLFFFCLWLQQQVTLPIKFSGFFAIIVLMNIFVAYCDKMRTELSSVGRYSLQIYVFHWFLIPSLLPLGSWLWLQNDSLMVLPNENIVIFLLISFIIAIPIIVICLILGKMVKRSFWLNYLLFGGK